MSCAPAALPRTPVRVADSFLHPRAGHGVR